MAERVKGSLPLRLAGRLAAYSSAAGALLVLSAESEAQVNYSGIREIGIDLDSGYVELDLNADQQNDFAFIVGSTQNTSTYNSFHFRYISRFAAIQHIRTDAYRNSWITSISTLRSSTYNGEVTYQYQAPVVRNLDSGFSIAPDSGSWNYASSLDFKALLAMSYTLTVTNQLFTLSYSGFIGNFGDEGFIGIRFYIGEALHYGWIRVRTLEGLDSMTVIDWAWEEIPETMIRAGDCVPGPNLQLTQGSASEDQVMIYPNPASDQLNLRLRHPSDIILTDMEGTIICEVKDVRDCSFQVGNLQAGVYIILIHNDQGIFRRKVLVGQGR
ncbi:MAG: T9SS type A sorting domain-containing protein [Bacteroidales bacterium]|nr:T9SS type A sorting domain-containing protein [Bacteroidales bacterium]